MNKEPRLNQIIFIDLGWRTKPYLIIKITKVEKEGKSFYFLHLLPISSQDESEIKKEDRKFISRIRIRQLPNCLKDDPSFVRVHRYVNLKNITKDDLIKFLCNKCPKGCFKKYINLKVELVDEYEILTKSHEDYCSDKSNALKLLPNIEIDWEKKRKILMR